MHHSLTIMRFTIHQSFNHTRVHSRSRSHQPHHVCTTHVYGQALAVMESSQCLVCGDHYKWWDAHDSNPSAGKVGCIAWVSVPPPPRAPRSQQQSTPYQPPNRPQSPNHLPDHLTNHTSFMYHPSSFPAVVALTRRLGSDPPYFLRR